MRVAWEYARKRPVGVEINSSVLKLDVLVLVNLSQTPQNAANALKVVANSLQNNA
jgi:hypothetical protein